MSFSPTTKNFPSSGSSYRRTGRIEGRPFPALSMMDGTLRLPAHRPILHESGGIITEGSHQMDQEERRHINVLALLEAAMAVVEDCSHHDGHHPGTANSGQTN